MQKAAKPLRLCGIGRNTPAKEPPGKREQPEFPGGKPALRGITAQTFGISVGHEMTRTGRRPRIDQELTVGANRLEAVMLDDNWFS
jgi:hypothetical protein